MSLARSCRPGERARGVYLGEAADEWDDLRPQLVADAEVVIAEIERVRP